MSKELVPEVIYKSGDLVVVNKPSGLLVHPTPKSNEETLADWLLENYPEVKGVGESEDRPGIVHRLDRETSGLMVAALNKDSYGLLKKAFHDREVSKKYYALVWGMPSKDKGKIDKEITVINGRRRTVEVYSQKEIKKTRSAVTFWEIKKDYGEYALLSVKPITGRTHQIRVHMDSVGHPLVCDSLYGKKRVCPKELGRLFLHAYFLQIPYKNNTLLEFEIEMPTDLKGFLDTIDNNN